MNYQEIFNSVFPAEKIQEEFYRYFLSDASENERFNIIGQLAKQFETTAIFVIPTNFEEFAVNKYLNSTLNINLNSTYIDLKKLFNLVNILKAPKTSKKKLENTINIDSYHLIRDLGFDIQKIVDKFGNLIPNSEEFEKLKNWANTFPLTKRHSNSLLDNIKTKFETNNKHKIIKEKFFENLKKQPQFQKLIEAIQEDKKLLNSIFTIAHIDDIENLTPELLDRTIETLKNLGLISSKRKFSNAKEFKEYLSENNRASKFIKEANLAKLAADNEYYYEAQYGNSDYFNALVDEISKNLEKTNKKLSPKEAKDTALCLMEYLYLNSNTTACYFPHIRTICLPAEKKLSLSTIIHETMHAISTPIQKRTAYSGYRKNKDDVAFNEIVTEFLTLDLVSNLENKFEMQIHSNCAYDRGCLNFKTLLNYFKPQIKQDFLCIGKMNAFESAIGAENFKKLKQISSEYLNFDDGELFESIKNILKIKIINDIEFMKNFDHILEQSKQHPQLLKQIKKYHTLINSSQELCNNIIAEYESTKTL